MAKLTHGGRRTAYVVGFYHYLEEVTGSGWRDA